MSIEVNYLSILIAAVLSMALGFLWYSPLLFGKQWMKLSGLTTESLKKAQKEMGKLYGVSFILSLITSYVLSHIMNLSGSFYDFTKLSIGVTTAFFLWLGFMMPVQLTGEIFGSKNWKLFTLNTGYQLVSVIIMGIVLAVL